MKGGGRYFFFEKKISFPLDVMQNSVVSSKNLAKVYRQRLKECDQHNIQQYYDQN